MDSTIKGFLSSHNLNTQRTESDDRIEEYEQALANMQREYDKRGDRIKELESQLKTVLDRETSILRYYDAKLDAAEAKLAVAVAALEDVNTFGDCGLQHIVRPAIAKIKGEQP